MKRFLLLTLLLTSLPLSAQRYSVGTNAVDWLSLGTLNAEHPLPSARRCPSMSGPS